MFYCHKIPQLNRTITTIATILPLSSLLTFLLLLPKIPLLPLLLLQPQSLLENAVCTKLVLQLVRMGDRKVQKIILTATLYYHYNYHFLIHLPKSTPSIILPILNQFHLNPLNYSHLTVFVHSSLHSTNIFHYLFD